MKVTFLAIIATLIFLSCAAYKPPKVYKFPKSKSYNMNYDAVWGKVIDWFGNHNTPIKNLDKTSGFISTEYSLQVDKYSDDCDCGTSGSLQHFKKITGNFNIIVKKISDTQTKVNINTFFKGYIEEYNWVTERYITREIDCNSKGNLENDILIYVNK